VLAGAIAGVILALAMGLILSFSLFNFSALPLVGVFIGLGSLGLVAVALALSALIAMVAKLAAPKRLVATFWVASIVAVVLGAVAMIGLIMSGQYSSTDQTRDVVTKKDIDLMGVKKLSISSNETAHIIYVVSNEQPRAETHRPNYLKEQPMAINVSGADDKQLTVVPSMSSMCRIVTLACNMTGEVTVYGPVLEEVSVGSGVQFTYKNNAPQSQLKLTYQDGVSGGNVHVEIPGLDTLAIVVSSGGVSSADIVATKVGIINAAVSADSQMALSADANVDAINIHTNGKCEPGADSKLQLMYKNVRTVTVQDQPIILPREDQLQTTQSCVTAQPIGRSFDIKNN
jgi:hypothetical protein